jgi:hypothetical protein
MEAAPMLADKRWKYAVPMWNEKTGERRIVVVELSRDERSDVLRNYGHTDELIVNGYAGHRAERQMPGFWVSGEIERVVLH